jgi:hypothetical protein
MTMLAQRLRDLVRGLDPIPLDHLDLLCGRVRQIPARKTRRGRNACAGVELPAICDLPPLRPRERAR